MKVAFFIVLFVAFTSGLSSLDAAALAKEYHEELRQQFPYARESDYPELILALEKRAQELRSLNITEPKLVGACSPIPRSSTKPTNINCVRFSDIVAVGAIGDSLTAGFGALCTNIFCATTEYRGVAWTIGGDTGKLTLPNFFKELGATVTGYSTGTGGACSSSNTRAGYNCAVSGAVAVDMKTQATNLASLMISRGQASEWKVITIFIGGNDLCKICKTRPDPAVAKNQYSQDLQAALTILRDKLPNTFVNLIAVVDVIKLKEFVSSFCSTLISSSCPCVTSNTQSDHAFSRLIAAEYQLAAVEIGELPEFNTNQFKVIVQPHFTETDVPRTSTGAADTTYFGVDCFHFSGKAHASVAIALANSMIHPPVSKRQSIDFNAKEWGCPPSDYPWIPTGITCSANQ
eukprot:TRINITY_DN5730_c0_g1_i1.p1 TRINITY_DN5730_c0_g1~~TRINITY_DN5730_c0_g1_i1.p1  ORF type:complete len:404 (-),score=49.61 TRINITY_DN5730_c0_g1_i1:60-1271(-)